MRGPLLPLPVMNLHDWHPFHSLPNIQILDHLPHPHSHLHPNILLFGVWCYIVD